MLRFLFILGFALVSAGVTAQAADQLFFSKMPDVPIMRGLTEIEAQAFVFDKPEGRIVESVALVSFAKPDDVIDFYHQSLPQLGWRERTPLRYERGGEMLEMEFETHENEKVFKIMIRPEE